VYNSEIPYWNITFVQIMLTNMETENTMTVLLNLVKCSSYLYKNWRHFLLNTTQEVLCSGNVSWSNSFSSVLMMVYNTQNYWKLQKSLWQEIFFIGFIVYFTWQMTLVVGANYYFFYLFLSTNSWFIF
jgi:hypothetical protein